MSLTPGTRLGPYDIVAPLGAGGMGEVYRARDTRLGREVAIKVLPEAFAADPALRARFDREAKTISSLNHPNICTLYDVGREGDTDYLVLELVEGETLAARISRGALPLADLLRYGLQVTDALEKAHKAGIVHRDLKPGNVMLTKAGAKLLDFGLARGGPLAGAGADATISPAVTGPLTAQGHIVGTFQYMAPEQLEGVEADVRSDLWALGCILYEMATGHPAFAGASQASLISSIMKDEPRPLVEVVPLSPPALDRAIGQCLAKDPEERWQTAGDLRRELAWISASGSQASAVAMEAAEGSARRRRALRATPLGRVLAWVIPLVVGAAIPAALWFAQVRSTPPAPARLAMIHEQGGDLDRDPASMAIAPDGSALVYVSLDSTGNSVWVRRFAEPASKLVAHSSTPIMTPFWSPDSRQVAWFTSGEDGRLWRAPIEGGAPIALAPASSGRGGAWSPGGTIVFAPAPAGPLLQVSASGGEVTHATELDTTAGESAHRAPRFLPDGDHFLYAATPDTPKGYTVYVGSLKKGRSEFLTHLPQHGAAYAAPGWLLYARDGKLLARRFDAGSRRFKGEAFVLVDAIPMSSQLGCPSVTASRTGRLAWPSLDVNNNRLEWLDRTGRITGRIDAPDGRYGNIAIGPDSRQALVSRFRASGEYEVYHYDPDRGALRRVSPPGFKSYAPLWAPDGESFFMRSGNAGRDENYRASLIQSSPPEKIQTTDHQFKGPMAVTPDGRTLLFNLLTKKTGWDIWTVALDGGGPPHPLLEGPGDDAARLSPNGRWLAIVDFSSGSSDVFIAPLDRPQSQKRILSGVLPVAFWTREGRELIFARRFGDAPTFYALPMDPATGMPAGPEQKLFNREGVVDFAVSPDGSRFLASVEDGKARTPFAEIVLDWTKLPRAR